MTAAVVQELGDRDDQRFDAGRHDGHVGRVAELDLLAVLGAHACRVDHIRQRRGLVIVPYARPREDPDVLNPPADLGVDMFDVRHQLVGYLEDVVARPRRCEQFLLLGDQFLKGAHRAPDHGVGRLLGLVPGLLYGPGEEHSHGVETGMELGAHEACMQRGREVRGRAHQLGRQGRQPAGDEMRDLLVTQTRLPGEDGTLAGQLGLHTS